jgi:hypothetical protein
MDVPDGFVPGIYNYCDRWCETCAFTSRCRAFADRLAMEASFDSNLSAVVNAPPLPQDRPAPMPGWLRECIEEMNEAAAGPATAEDLAQLLPKVPPEHHGVEDRARGYSFGVANWLQTIAAPPDRDYVDPRAVVAHDFAFIPAKIYRALTGLRFSREDPEDWPADHDGSAKVALLSIERSRAAWIDMAERGLAPIAIAARFVSDLSRLADDLDRIFPNARAFRRPGFDEPGEVAKLE